MTRLPRALSPLRHSHYRLLAASMALSLLAAGLWAVAVVWQVVALRGGPAALSLVTALAAGGMLASTLLGGALADRIPQRRILLAVALTQTVATPPSAGRVRRTGVVGSTHRQAAASNDAMEVAARAAPGEKEATRTPAAAGPAAFCSSGRTIPSRPLTASSSPSGTSAGTRAEYAG